MPSLELRELSALRALVDARATSVGRTFADEPGLFFFRATEPSPLARASVTSLYAGFILQGKKRIRVGGRDLVFGPPSYIVVTGEADFDSAVIEASPERPYLSFGIVVPPDMVAEMLLDLAASEIDVPSRAPAESPPPAYTACLTPALIGAFARLLEISDDPAERHVLLPMRLREVLFHLLRSEAAHTLRCAVEGPGDAMRIREAMAFMREHAHERLTVVRVARRFGMSESHFAHRFREVVRVSPMRYVKHERLARARLLMLSEGRRSAEVATSVGYASASQFTRDFKSYYGVPPVEYARRFRGASTPDRSGRAAGSSKTSAAVDLSRKRAAS